MTAAGLHVVRLRARAGQWTSPSLPLDDARELFLQLREQIDQVGAGQAFVYLVCRDERDVAVRAREVVSVELAPEWVRERDDRGARNGHDRPRPVPIGTDATGFLTAQGGDR